MAQMLFDIAVLLSDGVKYTLGIFVKKGFQVLE